MSYLTGTIYRIIFSCFIIRYTYGITLGMEEGINRIDNLLRQLLNCGDGSSRIPGLAIAIVYKGRVFTKGYGVTDFSRPKPVTEKTLFGVGPLSKTFTATLLAKQLAEHSRFTLDTPIARIIPGKFRFHDAMRTAKASSKDLLGQRIGLVSHSHLVFQQGLTRKRLAFKMRHMKRAAKFRDSYINSDIMYSLAAFVSESLSNRTWEDLVRTELFRPLRMTRSTFFNELEPDAKHLASAYYPQSSKLRKISTHYFREATKIGGAQSMVSNAVDMAKWIQFILSDGTRRGKQLLSKDALEETFSSVRAGNGTHSKFIRKPWAPDTLIDKGPTLGWRKTQYKGREILSNTRSARSLVIGYQSHMTVIRSMGFGIFTTCSGNDLNYLRQTALHTLIADTLLDDDGSWLNASSMCTFPAPWFNPPSSIRKMDKATRKAWAPTSNYNAYVGVYYNSIYGKITVFWNNGVGKLQLQYGPIRTDLEPMTKRNSFRAQGLDDFWPFLVKCVFKAKKGKPSYLNIPEFVPNYPTNPIRFKCTGNKLPEEFLKKQNMTRIVSQSPTPTISTQPMKMPTVPTHTQTDMYDTSISQTETYTTSMIKSSQTISTTDLFTEQFVNFTSLSSNTSLESDNRSQTTSSPQVTNATVLQNTTYERKMEENFTSLTTSNSPTLLSTENNSHSNPTQLINDTETTTPIGTSVTKQMSSSRSDIISTLLSTATIDWLTEYNTTVHQSTPSKNASDNVTQVTDIKTNTSLFHTVMAKNASDNVTQVTDIKTNTSLFHTVMAKNASDNVTQVTDIKTNTSLFHTVMVSSTLPEAATSTIQVKPTVYDRTTELFTSMFTSLIKEKSEDKEREFFTTQITKNTRPSTEDNNLNGKDGASKASRCSWLTSLRFPLFGIYLYILISATLY